MIARGGSTGRDGWVRTVTCLCLLASDDLTLDGRSFVVAMKT